MAKRIVQYVHRKLMKSIVQCMDFAELLLFVWFSQMEAWLFWFTSNRANMQQKRPIIQICSNRQHWNFIWLDNRSAPYQTTTGK